MNSELADRRRGIHSNLGDALSRVGDPEAIEHLHKALELGCRGWEVYPWLAVSYAWVGDEERTKEYESKARQACSQIEASRGDLFIRGMEWQIANARGARIKADDPGNPFGTARVKEQHEMLRKCAACDKREITAKQFRCCSRCRCTAYCSRGQQLYWSL